MALFSKRTRVKLQRRFGWPRRTLGSAVLTRGFAAKAAILITLTIATALAFHTNSLPLALMQVGDTWVGETLVASEGFAIDKSADSLAAEQLQARRMTEPIFVKQIGASERVGTNLDTLQVQMDRIMQAYRDYRLNIQRAHLASDTLSNVNYWALSDADSIRYVQWRQDALVFLSDEQWRMLGNDFVSRDPDMLDSSRLIVPGPPLYQIALDHLWMHVTAYSATDVVDIPVDSIYTDYIKVRNTEASTFERIPKSRVFAQDHIYQSVTQALEPHFAAKPRANVAVPLVNAVFVSSLQHDVGATERARNQAAQAVSPTRGMITADEIIVRKGEIITAEVMQRLRSLERTQAEASDPRIFEARSMGKLLLAFCIFSLFFVYLFVARRHLFDSNKDMFLIALLYAAIIGLYAVAVRNDSAYLFAVPTLIVTVMLTVVFDARVGLFGTVVLALVGGLVADFNHAFEFAFATIAGGALAVFTVLGARNRAQFFASGGAAFGGYVLVFLSFELFDAAKETFLNHVMMAGANCFLLVAANPLLWVVERTFNVSSELRLVELSDFNQPLLKKLQQAAPGSFNHSIQVANLAESAAESIGANSLLTRVGALYHDIGKVGQPEFFSENQRSGVNPHAAISARESAEIIKQHVVHGQELAADHGLPKNLVEFIPMHHGTTRIEYFYHKARQEADEDQAINEADYRYPGPRPTTKEAAILMLTDGVEAACKSITEPTIDKIEERVNAIFKARIDDNQLDESGLTLKDLKLIKASFVKQLSAIYHVRVKYPGQQ